MPSILEKPCREVQGLLTLSIEPGGRASGSMFTEPYLQALSQTGRVSIQHINISGTSDFTSPFTLYGGSVSAELAFLPVHQPYCAGRSGSVSHANNTVVSPRQLFTNLRKKVHSQFLVHISIPHLLVCGLLKNAIPLRRLIKPSGLH